MATTFASLKLKLNISTVEVKHGDHVINVLQYLPIEDKHSIVRLTLQNSMTNKGYYDDVLIDKYFGLYIVYMYTNLQFTDKQREDEDKTYDLLCGSGLLNEIMHAIPESELNTLMNYLDDMKFDSVRYKNSAGAVIRDIIENMPANAENAANIIKEFNPEDYKNVIEFAKAANGNRPI